MNHSDFLTYPDMREIITSCMDLPSCTHLALKSRRSCSGTLRIIILPVCPAWIAAAQSWGQDICDDPTLRAYTPTDDWMMLPYTPFWCFAGCSYKPCDVHVVGILITSSRRVEIADLSAYAVTTCIPRSVASIASCHIPNQLIAYLIVQISDYIRGIVVMPADCCDVLGLGDRRILVAPYCPSHRLILLAVLLIAEYIKIAKMSMKILSDYFVGKCPMIEIEVGGGGDR